jgi:hypothetical protein
MSILRTFESPESALNDGYLAVFSAFARLRPQMERNQSIPSESIVANLATALNEDPAVLHAYLDQISPDLKRIIMNELGDIAELLWTLEDLPVSDIQAITRYARRRRTKRGL